MSALFPSTFEEVVFWVVFAGTVLATVWANRHREPPETVKRGVKSEQLAITLTVVFGIIVIPILLGYARIGALPNWLFYPGIALIVLGNILFFWVRSFLGRFHSGQVRVRADHSVVDRGPYHYLRHPLYAVELLTYAGLGLALQSWVALLLILIVFAVVYGNRIRIEEKFLAAELGNAYVDYMKRTKRLIPFIL